MSSVLYEWQTLGHRYRLCRGRAQLEGWRALSPADARWVLQSRSDEPQARAALLRAALVGGGSVYPVRTPDYRALELELARHDLVVLEQPLAPLRIAQAPTAPPAEAPPPPRREPRPERERVPFEMQLHDELYAPCSGVRYHLTLASGDVREGTTDGSGWLRDEVPRGKTTLTVRYTPPGYDHELCLRVRLTDADPNSDEALLCHLHNFGFAHDDGRDRGTLVRFQAAHRLATSGVLDGPTRAAILQIADGGDGSLRDALREDNA